MFRRVLGKILVLSVACLSLRRPADLERRLTVSSSLAKDFVGWTDGNVKRRQVLYLLQGWLEVTKQDTDQERIDCY